MNYSVTHLLSAFAFAAACCMDLQAQNTYLSEQFTEGIPSDYALYDEDGNEPSVDMANLGFAVGKPWICVTEGEDNNAVAASTSWYQKAGTSNDWMVTTSFEVKDAGAVLSWRARATDADYRDGYKVLVSTTGNRVADFTNEPVFSVSKENVAWTEHEVSLADYVGKTVWVAFVNNTKDRAMLYVDDLFAGVPACIELTSELTDGIVTRYGEVRVTGTVKAKKPITSFTVRLTLGDNKELVETFDCSLQPGGTANFQFGEPVPRRSWPRKSRVRGAATACAASWPWSRCARSTPTTTSASLSTVATATGPMQWNLILPSISISYSAISA